MGAIVTTGLGGKITSLIFVYAGGSLLAALVATMVVCIILGMGMPVPSAYVVTAVLAGPPLALMGLSTRARVRSSERPKGMKPSRMRWRDS